MKILSGYSETGGQFELALASNPTKVLRGGFSAPPGSIPSNNQPGAAYASGLPTDPVVVAELIKATVDLGKMLFKTCAQMNKEAIDSCLQNANNVPHPALWAQICVHAAIPEA